MDPLNVVSHTTAAYKKLSTTINEYLAVPQLKRLVAGFPTATARVRPSKVMWYLYWTNWHWDRFPPSTSVYPANHHSTTKFSILIFTRGTYNRAIGGRSAEWSQLDSNLDYSKLNKKLNKYFFKLV
jgi:hypothetical protein